MADDTPKGMAARVAALEATVAALSVQVSRNTERLDALPPDLLPIPRGKA